MSLFSMPLDKENRMSVKSHTPIRLPHLPLDENTAHITQEMTDRVIEHLEDRYPDLIKDIARYEKGHTDASTLMAYAKAMRVVAEELSKTMETPESELEYIDLSFELVRRFRAALGFTLPKVQGRPLAPSLHGPYPERLAVRPISKFCVKAGFTQEQVETWGDEFYLANMQHCYENAEAWRREVSSGTLRRKSPSYIFFRKKAESASNPNLLKNFTLPAIELANRIRLTCGLVSR